MALAESAGIDPAEIIVVAFGRVGASVVQIVVYELLTIKICVRIRRQHFVAIFKVQPTRRRKKSIIVAQENEGSLQENWGISKINLR